MELENTEIFIEQLKSILEEAYQFRKSSQYDDFSDLSYSKTQKIISRSSAAVERITGVSSTYAKQIREITVRQKTFEGLKMDMIVGVVESLLSDLEAGYLTSFTEIIHGEIFSDFLEMAEYLLNEGYKDAAAVLSGGALESHLRQLCKKNKIDDTINTAHGIKSKKADAMNAELTKASVYTVLDQKSITSWLDLRNKAAHAKYDEYSKEQVVLLIGGVRDFISRNPA